MIQYQQELSQNIQKINALRGNCYLQKIYSTSSVICISCRSREKTSFFYLGRGNGIEGLWVSGEKVSPELRRIDRFLEYLRKHLGGAELLGATQIFNDRCLQLSYRKFGHENLFLFFWRGRKLYFLNYFFDHKLKKICLMKSWQGKDILDAELSSEKLYAHLQDIGLEKSFTGNFKTSKTSIEEVLKREKEKLLRLNSSPRKKKQLRKKLEKITQDLDRIEDCTFLQRKLQMEEVDFSNIKTELSFGKIKLKFKQELTSYQKRDRAFEKIKAYKRGTKILWERKRLVEYEIEKVEEGVPETLERQLEMVEPYWILPRRRKHKGESIESAGGVAHPEVRFFRTEDGILFALGMSAGANDFLRSKWANRKDWWFHIEGYVGAHAVIKESSWENIGEEVVSLIASSLRDFSKLEILEIPIIFTRVENLRGVKGGRGKVLYKKERYLRVDYRENWRKGLVAPLEDEKSVG